MMSVFFANIQPILWRRLCWQSTPSPERASAVQGVYSQHIAQPFQPKWRKEEHKTIFPLPFVRASLWQKRLQAELAEHILGPLPTGRWD